MKENAPLFGGVGEQYCVCVPSYNPTKSEEEEEEVIELLSTAAI